MTWWEIVLTVWILGSFPLAVLISKACAHGHAPPATRNELATVTTLQRARSRRTRVARAS